MSRKWTISEAQNGDIQATMMVLILGWLENYNDPELGLDEGWLIHSRIPNLEYGKYLSGIEKGAYENSDNNLFMVAKDENGLVVGFIHCFRDRTEQTIHELYVYKEFQGTGLAHDLMSHFESWEDKGMNSQLGVVSFNKRAIKFYEKYGFRDSGVKYEVDSRLPCIDMIKFNKDSTS